MWAGESNTMNVKVGLGGGAWECPHPLIFLIPCGMVPPPHRVALPSLETLHRHSEACLLGHSKFFLYGLFIDTQHVTGTQVEARRQAVGVGSLLHHVGVDSVGTEHNHQTRRQVPFPAQHFAGPWNILNPTKLTMKDCRTIFFFFLFCGGGGSRMEDGDSTGEMA